MESEWIRLAQTGDKKAFEALILQHEKMVYNIACRMLHNEEEAKDAAQEALIKVYRHIKKFNGQSTFSTWVYRVTVNTCLDALRKKKATHTVSLDDDTKHFANMGDVKQKSPEDFAIHKERAQMILAAVNALELDAKTVIILRDINGFSYADIADILDINMGTVKSRIARARERLKASLTRSMEQYGESSRQKDGREGPQ